MPIASNAVPPPPVFKRNTVGVVQSKISHEMVIPVCHVDSIESYAAKNGKPYEIIEGRHPFDNPWAPPSISLVPHHEQQQQQRNSSNNSSARGSVQGDLETHPKNATPATRCRRTSRNQSPPVSTNAKETKQGTVAGLAGTPGAEAWGAEEEEHEFISEVTASPLLQTMNVPRRPGFAKSVLRLQEPYQLVTSRTLETHIRYQLDDEDYEWCLQTNQDRDRVKREGGDDDDDEDDEDEDEEGDKAVRDLQKGKIEPCLLQQAFSFLEWAYVSYLLKAVAQPHKHGQTSSGRTGSGAAGRRNRGTGGAEAGEGGRTPPTNAKERHQSQHAPCCVCSQTVNTTLPRHPYTKNAATTAAAPAHHNSNSANHVSRYHHGSLPLTDVYLTRHGLTCAGCGLTAHFRCWGLTDVWYQNDPNHNSNHHHNNGTSSPSEWVCDVCCANRLHNSFTATRTRVIRCAFCSLHGGGPLFRYFPPHQLPVSDELAGSPMSPSSPSAEQWCHLCCALALPELSVVYPDTTRLANGNIDMSQRPYVIHVFAGTVGGAGQPGRRPCQKQKYMQLCTVCQNTFAPSIRCAHPNCFEHIHPLCATLAHTFELFTTPVEDAPPPPAPSDAGTAAKKVKAEEGEKSTTSPADHRALLMWARGVPYCEKHFGASLNQSSLSSHTLHELAEREALKLDLTGIMHQSTETRRLQHQRDGSGGSGGTASFLKAHALKKKTAPVVPIVKRGRGRPPVQVSLQRTAERELFQRIKEYWLQRRRARYQEGVQWMQEINETKVRPVVSAALRPELIKVALNKVRMSYFLSLVPEWQQLLVLYAEGELPLPDDEYDDASPTSPYGSYRRGNATTRRSGNNEQLLERMQLVSEQLDTLQSMCEHVKRGSKLRTQQVELELQYLALAHPILDD